MNNEIRDEHWRLIGVVSGLRQLQQKARTLERKIGECDHEFKSVWSQIKPGTIASNVCTKCGYRVYEASETHADIERRRIN